MADISDNALISPRQDHLLLSRAWPASRDSGGLVSVLVDVVRSWLLNPGAFRSRVRLVSPAALSSGVERGNNPSYCTLPQEEAAQRVSPAYWSGYHNRHLQYSISRQFYPLNTEIRFIQ